MTLLAVALLGAGRGGLLGVRHGGNGRRGDATERQGTDEECTEEQHRAGQTRHTAAVR